MRTKIIEAVGPAGSRGSFLVGLMDVEWDIRTGRHDVTRTVRDEMMRDRAWWEPRHSPEPLLGQLRWGPRHLLVVDLQTGQGAFFRSGGYVRGELEKHDIRVGPLFEPFLEWLNLQDLRDLDALPTAVETDAPMEVSGYPRSDRSEPPSDLFDLQMAARAAEQDLRELEWRVQQKMEERGRVAYSRDMGASLAQVALDGTAWVSLTVLGGFLQTKALEFYNERLRRRRRPTMNETVATARWAINENWPDAVPMGTEPVSFAQGPDDWEVKFRLDGVVYTASARWAKTRARVKRETL